VRNASLTLAGIHSLRFAMTDYSYLQPGMTFVRAAITKALAHKSGADPVDFARARWGRDAAVIPVLKAAVSGGETSGAWGGLTDVGAAAREFIDAVAPMTVIGKLEGLRRVSARVPYVISPGTAIAYWIGESKSIKVSPGAFNRSAMAPLKIGCLLVASNETLNDTSAEGEAAIRRDMLRAVALLSEGKSRRGNSRCSKLNRLASQFGLLFPRSQQNI